MVIAGYFNWHHSLNEDGIELHTTIEHSIVVDIRVGTLGSHGEVELTVEIGVRVGSIHQSSETLSEGDEVLSGRFDVEVEAVDGGTMEGSENSSGGPLLRSIVGRRCSLGIACCVRRSSIDVKIPSESLVPDALCACLVLRLDACVGRSEGICHQGHATRSHSRRRWDTAAGCWSSTSGGRGFAAGGCELTGGRCGLGRRNSWNRGVQLRE